jgi:hypothetical protein
VFDQPQEIPVSNLLIQQLSGTTLYNIDQSSVDFSQLTVASPTAGPMTLMFTASSSTLYYGYIDFTIVPGKFTYLKTV